MCRRAYYMRIASRQTNRLTKLPQHFTLPPHTIILRLFWILSRTTRVSRYQEGKTNLDLLEQEIVSGSGICWAICKSAPHPRQITMTMPTYHHSVLYRPDALPAAQPTVSKHWRQHFSQGHSKTWMLFVAGHWSWAESLASPLLQDPKFETTTYWFAWFDRVHSQRSVEAWPQLL